MTREQDMQVAELLGYRWMTNRYTPGRRFLVGPSEALYIRQSEATPAPLSLPLADHPAVTVPAFSTDIAAAWTLTDEARARGYQVAIQSVFGSFEWKCAIWRGEHIGRGQSTSPAAAIVAAFLAAMDAGEV